MAPILLLGAGFSRNWGGWLAAEVFEYLLGDPVVRDNNVIRNLLWKHQSTGGFEYALEELEELAKQDPRRGPERDALHAAVGRMFEAMNASYIGRGLEFQKLLGERYPVHEFLARFDAIFSLNQDLLLERCYLKDKGSPFLPPTFSKWQIPGMCLLPGPSDQPTHPSAVGTWVPSGDQSLSPEDRPLFKLHGSSNWRTSDDRQMTIIGGGKAQAISRHPVLAWYAEEFKNRISQSDARLMIIGYGFRDDHINAVLQEAAGNGLKVFVIDLNGADALSALTPVPRGVAGYKPSPLEEAIRNALIGASRRTLATTFGGDTAEHAKVMRFFEA